MSEIQTGDFFEHLAKVKGTGVHGLGDSRQGKFLGDVLLNVGSCTSNEDGLGVVLTNG